MPESKSNEEMLRKAREYVEKHKRKTGSRRKDHLGGSDDGNASSSENEKDKRKKKSKKHHHRKERRSREYDEENDSDNDKKKKRSRSSSKDDRKKSSKSSRGEKKEKEKEKSKRSSRSSGNSTSSSSRSSSKKRKGHADDSSDNGSNHDNVVNDKNSKRTIDKERTPSKEKKKSSSSSSSKKSKKEKKKDISNHDNSDNERKKKKHKKKHHKESSSTSNTNTSKTFSQYDKKQIEKITLLLGPIQKSFKPKTEISHQDDYFTYHNHLRLFLFHTKKRYFEDLSSSQTHEAFKEFCDMYNKGELQKEYYNEKMILPDEAMDACKRTKHRWNFNTNKTEQKSLDLIKSGVKKQTEYENTGDRSIPQPKLQRPMMLCVPAGGGGGGDGNGDGNGGSSNNVQSRPMIPERNDKKNPDQQSAMLKMLGLKGVTPGQKITIAPRK